MHACAAVGRPVQAGVSLPLVLGWPSAMSTEVAAHLQAVNRLECPDPCLPWCGFAAGRGCATGNPTDGNVLSIVPDARVLLM